MSNFEGYRSRITVGTYTFTEVIVRWPFGSAVKTKEESAIVARRHITQDVQKAEMLFTREYRLCIADAENRLLNEMKVGLIFELTARGQM
jgi:hypothetical protein